MGAESPIPKEYFLKALEPLKWVDWLDQRLHKMYGGGGEPGRQALRIWMEGAIREGTVHEKDEVMSDERPSGYGKRILAGPANSKIEITSDQEWPMGTSDDDALVMRSNRPPNTYATSTWSIFDSNRVRRVSEDIDARNGYAELILRKSSWMDETDTLQVRVDWNWVRGEGFAEKNLEKPEED